MNVKLRLLCDSLQVLKYQNSPPILTYLLIKVFPNLLCSICSMKKKPKLYPSENPPLKLSKSTMWSSS